MEKLGKYRFEGLLLHFAHCIFCMSVRIGPTSLLFLFCLFATHTEVARLPLPSLSPGVCSKPCPLSQWCHPAISSSVIPFSSCPQSFPAPESFPMGRLFVPGGQSIGASASVLPMNIRGWFPFKLTGLIFLQSKGLSRVLSSTTLAFFMVQLSHPYKTTGKTIVLTIWTFVGKVISLLFNMLSWL